eukprot:1160248-Pelagomonas_calceolata.AAC.4
MLHAPQQGAWRWEMRHPAPGPGWPMPHRCMKYAHKCNTSLGYCSVNDSLFDCAQYSISHFQGVGNGAQCAMLVRPGGKKLEKGDKGWDGGCAR